MINKLVFLITLLILAASCKEVKKDRVKGALMIIGGGNRPDVIIDRILGEADVSQKNAYGIVLTMAGSNPDTSGYYGEKPFRENGFENMFSIDLGRTDSVTSAVLDSVEKASFMYISGGDQSRFMHQIEDHPEIGEAIFSAYQNGSIISGSSAGAAIMSKIMITGDQAKHPEYTSTFYHLEKNNLIVKEGLGLIEGVIIDQHFIKRARNNRLITAVMEYPENIGIGIDESTAIFVRGNTAEVVGLSQVLVYINNGNTQSTEEELFKDDEIKLGIYTHGDVFNVN